MTSPKPISLTRIDAEDYTGQQEPQEFVVIGSMPGGGGAGGGAVDSVNGETGDVVLTAADLGAATSAELAAFVETAEEALTGLSTDVASKATQSSVNAISQAQVTLAQNLDAVDDKADDALASIVVLGVLNHDQTPPSAGVWLRRPAP